MAKQMKTWNGYEIVDDAARKDIAGLKEEMVNNLTWEKIKDKPFGGFNISWDGDTANRINIQNAYLVSADVLTIEDFADGVIMTLISEYGEGEIKEIEIGIDDIVDMNGMLLDNYGMINIIPYDNFVVNTEWGDFTIPKKGVYFKNLINDASHAYDLYEPYVSNLRSKNFSPLDEKYIPSSIARKSDITGGAGGGIIDVVELPKEDIREDCFYRLVSAKFVYDNDIYENWTIQCVNGLPENPEPVTRDVVNIYAYYNTEDNDVYGYVDDFVAQAAGGVPAGWYTLGQLAPAFDLIWVGVIDHIDKAEIDDSWKALVTKSLHIYDNGWKELPYAYESEPEFDITWDGVVGDRFALDMSMLGYENLYYVKVSDEVFTVDYLQESKYIFNESYGYNTLSDEYNNIDTAMYDGAIVCDNAIIIVYSADELNASLGLPDGYITNGTYFFLNTDINLFTSHFVSSKKVMKIDGKFIDIDLATVATSGDYVDLTNKPTIYTDVIRYSTSQSLSNTNKSRARANIDVYSKSEVDTKIANSSSNVDLSEYSKTTEIEAMIANAIGNAIGGSY